MIAEIFLTNLNLETVVLILSTSALAGLLFHDKYDYKLPMAITTSFVIGLMLRLALTNAMPSIWNSVDLAMPVTFVSGIIYNTAIAMFAAYMGRQVFTRKIVAW